MSADETDFLVEEGCGMRDDESQLPVDIKIVAR